MAPSALAGDWLDAACADRNPSSLICGLTLRRSTSTASPSRTRRPWGLRMPSTRRPPPPSARPTVTVGPSRAEARWQWPTRTHPRRSRRRTSSTRPPAATAHQQQVPRVSLLAGCPQRGLCATVHPIEPEEDAEWRATPAPRHEAMGAAELEKEVERRKRYPATRPARAARWQRRGAAEPRPALCAAHARDERHARLCRLTYGLVVAWQFAQQPFGPTPWRMTNDEGLQTAILPTDAAWPNPSATFRFDVLDESRTRIRDQLHGRLRLISSSSAIQMAPLAGVALLAAQRP